MFVFAVNDPFVTAAWGESAGAGGKVCPAVGTATSDTQTYLIVLHA